MLKFYYSSEKTNSFRPTPWHLSDEPFIAFRGNSHTYRSFLAIAKDLKININDLPRDLKEEYSSFRYGETNILCKIIKTKAKGTNLLVPASKKDDEKIGLLTLRGGFRGGYFRIEIVDGEIIDIRSGNKHCCPTAHLIVRFNNKNSYVYAETGRRCSTSLIEIFHCNDGYSTMPIEEFEVMLELNEK